MKKNPVYKGMTVTLTDNDGTEVDYTLMDAIEYDSRTYVYFIRNDEMDSDEPNLYITEYKEDEAVFDSVTNEVLLDELYDVFLEENEEFASEDEDDDDDDDDEDEDDDASEEQDDDDDDDGDLSAN